MPKRVCDDVRCGAIISLGWQNGAPPNFPGRKDRTKLFVSTSQHCRGTVTLSALVSLMSQKQIQESALQNYRANNQPYIGAEDSHRRFAQYAEVEPRLVGFHEQALAPEAGWIAEMLDEFE